jgi:hypothetical protein
MSDPDITEAAARALRKEPILFDYPDECLEIVRVVLTAVAPLIRATALEEAAQMVEGLGGIDDEEWVVIAQDIRALIIPPPKEQP